MITAMLWLWSDEEDAIFYLEESSQQGSPRDHTNPAPPRAQANRGRAGSLEMNLADDPELARLGGIPPAERVFMYLQARLIGLLSPFTPFGPSACRALMHFPIAGDPAMWLEHPFPGCRRSHAWIISSTGNWSITECFMKGCVLSYTLIYT